MYHRNGNKCTTLVSALERTKNVIFADGKTIKCRSDMSNVKTTMIELRAVLQALRNGESRRKIERDLKLSRTSIKAYEERALESGCSYEELLSKDDGELNGILRREGGHRNLDQEKMAALEPLLAEYARRKAKYRHLTYDALYEEYCGRVEAAYSYTQFKERLKDYEGRHDYVFHNEHRPGHEMQADYAGDNLYVTDPHTGELRKVYVLMCVLPCSGQAFAIGMHTTRMEEFFHGLSASVTAYGGVPEVVKSDNMTQWVKKYDRYEPRLNDAAIAWALHYGTQIDNCRVRKPRDKGMVEGLVYQAYRYIYSRIERGNGNGEPMVFHSLEELNAELFSLTDSFNRRLMQGRPYSRQMRFEEYERECLKPLPETPFLFRYEKRCTIKSGYHVRVDTGTAQHFYSVPCEYIGKEAKVVFDLKHVEVWIDLKRVAVHDREFTDGYTTLNEHMPERHREYVRQRDNFNAAYFISMARHIGPCTTEAVQGILESKPFLQQSYKACQGVLSLSRKYGADRLEKVCSMIPDRRYANYTRIKDMLRNNTDMRESVHANQSMLPYIPSNDDVRGAAFYQ